MRSPLVGLTALAIVASTTPGYANAALYRCPLNVDVVANYSADAKNVTLYTQGQTFHLPVAMSGSGARYSDGKTTIWEHQGEAIFETPGAAFTGCKLVPINH
jgi:membrane-bound inhibitor of C-type lysozyme